VQSNNRSKARTFQNRLTRFGFDGGRLFHFLASVQDGRDLTDSDRKRVSAILKANPGLEDPAELSDDDVSFIDGIIEKCLETSILGPENAPSITRPIVKVRRFVFSIIGLACIFVLISALASGRSSVPYFSENPAHALVVVLLLMGILFLLEGTQISIATLRLKDIDLVPSIKPSVRNLHARYRSEENVQHYLAGRQLFTIITVFFISRICSFPDVARLPGTGLAIPELLSPWFSTIFFDFGILAALVALWLAQLAPQFWANKQPVRFLSLPLAKLTVRLSHAFESSGITDLGYALTNSITPEEKIPTSTRETYNSYAVSNGYAATGVSIRWRVGVDELSAEVREDFEFQRAGLAMLNVTEEIQGRCESRKPLFQLLRGGESPACDVDESETLKIGDNTTRKYIVQPRHAAFEAGDVVVKTLNFSAPRNATKPRRFYLSRPVRYLLLTLEVSNDVSIGRPRVQLIDEHHASPAHDFAELYSLDKISETGTTTTYAYFRSFPNTDVLYEFMWGRDG